MSGYEDLMGSPQEVAKSAPPTIEYNGQQLPTTTNTALSLRKKSKKQTGGGNVPGF